MCVGVLATGRCLYAVARARSRSAHALAIHLMVLCCVLCRAVPACCRPQLARGLMQLFSVEQQKSQPLEAHAAAFSTVKVCMSVVAASACVRGSRVGLLMAQQGHR